MLQASPITKLTSSRKLVIFSDVHIGAEAHAEREFDEAFGPGHTGKGLKVGVVEGERAVPAQPGTDHTVRKTIDTSRISAAAENFQRGSQVKAPEEVTITRKEYDRLLEAEAKLIALEAAGVDNWSGYDDAMQQLAAA